MHVEYRHDTLFSRYKLKVDQTCVFKDAPFFSIEPRTRIPSRKLDSKTGLNYIKGCIFFFWRNKNGKKFKLEANSALYVNTTAI